MSSIIKGERIRNQSIINLSEHFTALQIDYERDEIEDERVVIEHKENEPQESEEEEQVSPDTLREEVLAKAHEEAQILLQEAKRNADNILSSALKEAEKMKASMKEEQYNIIEHAKGTAQQLIQEATLQSEQLKEAAVIEKERIIGNSEHEILAMVEKLVGHIVSEELYVGTWWIKAMVQKMLHECHTKEQIKVFISKGNFENLTPEQKTTIESMAEYVTIAVGNTLNNSSCLIETKQGSIAYDLKDGLERVLAELRILEKLS